MNTAEKPIRLSIVVPVYRSAMVLPELVAQVGEEVAKSEYRGAFELILVNDRSPDESWQKIETLSSRYPFVRGISLRKNTGQHNATMAGLRYARGEILVIMDDDLQHPPSAIIRLAEQIESGSDVCYTIYAGRKHAAWKRLGSRFNDLMATLLLRKPRGLYLSSFKAMSRGVADTVLEYDGPYTYIDSLILSATDAISSLPIDHQDRWGGTGNYNLRRSISLWLKMATGSSVYPLRIATMLGFGVAALSLAFLVYVLVLRLVTSDIPSGWASIIAVLLFIGGLQMVFLGIIGEYVGRIYIRLNNTPQFVVAKTTFDDAQPAQTISDLRKSSTSRRFDS